MINTRYFDSPNGRVEVGDRVRVSVPRLEDSPDLNRDITGRFLGIKIIDNEPQIAIGFGDSDVGVNVPLEHADRVTKLPPN